MPKILNVKDGSYNAETYLKKQGSTLVHHKRFSKAWEVLSDDTLQDEDAILMTTGIPAIFAASNGAYCRKRKATEQQTVIHPDGGLAILWDVTADFDSEVDPNEDESDPLAKPPKTWWTSETIDEVIEKDINGNPVQTDAGEPLIVTEPVTIPVLNIKRYELYHFDPNVILDYANHKNSAAFWGAPAGACLFSSPETTEPETIDGTQYTLVTYRIKFKLKKENGVLVAGSWNKRVLHHGYKYIDPDDGEVKTYEINGQPATVNLQNGTGNPLGQVDPAEYLEWETKHEADFNALSLGPF
jgi:hypothetical protein